MVLNEFNIIEETIPQNPKLYADGLKDSFVLELSKSLSLSIPLNREVENTKPGKFPGPASLIRLHDLKPTWSSFLEEYGSGDLELSFLACPPCFNNMGYMSPPNSQFESKRVEEVRKLQDQSWSMNENIYQMAHYILKKYDLVTFSVSLVERRYQDIKFTINNNNTTKIARSASFDAHAILSKNYFTVLDAENDWRFAFNPLVQGPPFIRFYAAVPLLKDGYAVGAVSVQSTKKQVNISEGLINKLDQIRNIIFESITNPVTPSSNISIDEEMNSNEHLFKFDKNIQAEYYDDIYLEYGISNKISIYKDFDSNHFLKNAFPIISELLKCGGDTRHVMAKACQILCDNLKLEWAYIVEIRLCNKYQASSEQISVYPSGSICKQVPDLARILSRRHKKYTNMRILGSFNFDDNMKLDESIHRSAYSSKYGVCFSSRK